MDPRVKPEGDGGAQAAVGPLASAAPGEYNDRDSPPMDRVSKPLPALVRPPLRWLLRRWAATGRKSARLYPLIEKFGPRLATRPMRSRLPNGCWIECDFADFIQRHIYFEGLWDAVEAFLFTRLIEPGMTVIDAGANVGQFTMLAATAVGPHGSVHSFEPVERNFARLSANLAANRLTNVHPVRAALWNEDTELTIGLRADLEAKGNSGGWTIARQAGDVARLATPAMRLDTYAAAAGLKRVDLIKMDIQGAEPFAIVGGRELLRAHHPAILMELYEPCLAAMGSSGRELWEELHGLGYAAWRIDSSPRRCGPLESFAGVHYANVIMHRGALPAGVTGGWERRTPKRWACGGWRLSPF